MTGKLADFLKARGPIRLTDEDFLEAYAISMEKHTIPEIERQTRKNAERAAEIRFSPVPRRGKPGRPE